MNVTITLPNQQPQPYPWVRALSFVPEREPNLIVEALLNFTLDMLPESIRKYVRSTEIHDDHILVAYHMPPGTVVRVR